MPSGDVLVRQIPQGLVAPNRATVVQKPVMIQPSNTVGTPTTLQINALPQQTAPRSWTTTTIHALTPQSKPGATESRDELPGTVKLNQGVESLEPSGLAGASKSVYRYLLIILMCIYGLLFLLDASLVVRLLSHASAPR